ncbi:hypothetical protein K070079E91_43640 [Eisenbergiella porci]
MEEEPMAERIKSRAGLIAVTVVLIVISAFCIAGTVKGQSRDAFREEDGYYSRLEEDYLAQVRKILKEEGYANSGLTLTFSRDVRGEKTYLLKIHNRRFENLDKSEIQGILERIGKVEFGAPDCRIYQEFF